jgi:hypothetical protein
VIRIKFCSCSTGRAVSTALDADRDVLLSRNGTLGSVLILQNG